MAYPPIVIIGESGSGKSTLANELTRLQPCIKKVVTYTTRPEREGERYGDDYYFVEGKEFRDLIDKEFFAHYAVYRGWYFGVATQDCERDNVLVLTPAGLREIRKSLNVVSFYLKVDRKSRLIKLLKRGDDIEEAYRRSLSDVGQFDGIENEVDYVICNDNYQLGVTEIAKVILDIMDGKRIADDK